jgi:hypothetical protein
MVLDVASDDGQIALSRTLRSPLPEVGQNLDYTVRGEAPEEIFGAVPLRDIVTYLDAHRPSGIAAVLASVNASGKETVVVRGEGSARLKSIFNDAINGAPVVFE